MEQSLADRGDVDELINTTVECVNSMDKDSWASQVCLKSTIWALAF